MNKPRCPFCNEPAERDTKFEGILYCGRHGDFEWFDRGRMLNVDIIKIYQSYPYNISIENDYQTMRPRYLRGFRKRILRYFPKAQGLSFLDVGCANGEYLDCGRELGMSRVEGVEVDEKAVAKAKEFGIIFSSLKEIQDSFHIIQCKNVLSNIDNFHEFFSDMLSLIKPGGILFFDVLNQFGLVAWIKKMTGKPGILRPPFVVNGFSKSSVVALAEKHRAKLMSLETTYCGSDLLPYKKNISLSLRGILAKTLGAATMIVADIKT